MIAAGASVTLALASPPSGTPSPFLAFVRLRAAAAGDAYELPFGLGAFCFDPFAPDAALLASSYAVPSLLGTPVLTPWIAPAPTGIPAGITATIQAIVVTSPLPVVTNAISFDVR